MPPAATVTRRACTGIGVAGVAAGCAGMAAMLPGGAAAALGAIGIGSSSALARTLSPVAEPLFVASAILVIVGALACSRLVAAAVTGSALLYLSMFQLASADSTSGGSSMSMMSMQQHPHQGSAALHAQLLPRLRPPRRRPRAQRLASPPTPVPAASAARERAPRPRQLRDAEARSAFAAN